MFHDIPWLDHLDRMTDSTGIIQHGIYNVPRRESGYTTDDNARALRLCAWLWNVQSDDHMLRRISCYLSFLEHARCPDQGFHNFLSYRRDWLDRVGTGDCQGQAVLALAEVMASGLPDGYRSLARELIEFVIPTLADLRSLRAQAYVIQAWAQLWRAGVEDFASLGELSRLAADRLVDRYYRCHRSDWLWFESRMTYANAVIPHALFDAAQIWPQSEYRSVAESSFRFLDRVTTTNDTFCPVGNSDWYSRGQENSTFDQQPVEASTMASAALSALKHHGMDECRATFVRTHEWFHGRNVLGLPLADRRYGGCCDGLQANGVNQNQGAESTIAYLWTEWLAVSAKQMLDLQPAVN